MIQLFQIYSKTPFKNKFFELDSYISPIQIYSWAETALQINTRHHNLLIGFVLLGDVFSFSFDADKKRDHAGVKINVCVLGLAFDLVFYDHRHVDDYGNWIIYPEE